VSEREERIERYRIEDGLFPGSLAEAADRLSWSYTRLLVAAGVGRARRRLRRMMRS